MTRTLTASAFAIAILAFAAGITLSTQGAQAHHTSNDVAATVSAAASCTTFAMLAADPTSGRVASMARASCR